MLLIPAGILAGSVGGGIEPDGQFIPCGPVLFGRHVQDWDSRCVAADAGWRTFTLCILILGGLLLITAIASMVNNHSIRHARRTATLRDGTPFKFHDDSVRWDRQHETNPLRWWNVEATAGDEPPSRNVQ